MVPTAYVYQAEVPFAPHFYFQINLPILFGARKSWAFALGSQTQKHSLGYRSAYMQVACITTLDQV